MSKVTLEEIVALCKRRGFVFPGSQIYDGLAGTYDWGPLGVKLTDNIKNLFRQHFIYDQTTVHEISGSIMGAGALYQASGHTSTFSDPVVVDTKTGERYRADHLLEAVGVENVSELSPEQMDQEIKEKQVLSPNNNSLGPVQQFNLMFDVYPGAVREEETVAYLRPETAQSIFINFKNVLDVLSPKLPFGIAQIGKAYRNEIAPRNFLFRLRELEQLELEFFVRSEDWENQFSYWQDLMMSFAGKLGLSLDHLHQVEVPESDRAHYSERTIDFEFEYPFGQKELWGLAYRGDYDLTKHQEASGERLQYLDQETNTWITPHVIEPSLGLERTVLALLTSVYKTDEIGGEVRTYLAFNEDVAPYRYAVFPLLKNKPELVEKARELYKNLSQKFPGRVAWDERGNIGKRYRAQDEIGTPECITVDFDTLEDNTVTLRNRDTAAQERVLITKLY